MTSIEKSLEIVKFVKTSIQPKERTMNIQANKVRSTLIRTGLAIALTLIMGAGAQAVDPTINVTWTDPGEPPA